MVGDLCSGWVNRIPGYPESTTSFLRSRVLMISFTTVSTFELFLTACLTRLASRLMPNENVVFRLIII